MIKGEALLDTLFPDQSTFYVGRLNALGFAGLKAWSRVVEREKIREGRLLISPQEALVIESQVSQLYSGSLPVPDLFKRADKVCQAFGADQKRLNDLADKIVRDMISLVYVFKEKGIDKRSIQDNVCERLSATLSAPMPAGFLPELMALFTPVTPEIALPIYNNFRT